ncbi:MAG: phosphate signaling complex protein PhoU [Pseudomonadota bacterium]
MSHYEQRLEHDLQQIRSGIADMAGQVMTAIRNAVRAFQAGDSALAAATILADHSINRAMREIDRRCHAFIAVHLPSGSHLRLLSAAIRANIALERIGDYAVTIARASSQLTAPPGGEMGRELDRIANEACTMLDQAIEAFTSLNAEMARATMVLEQEMEYDLESVYSALTSNPDRESVKELLVVFVVLTHLKRVADQAKNLCEETVFAVTGEIKAPKVYHILFVDEDNSALAKMAELVARKTHPGSGSYSSCGRNPAAGLNPQMVRFLEQHGFDLSDTGPAPLDLTPQELVDKHVIVSLQGPVRHYFQQLPFHTTAVEWQVGAVPEEGDRPEAWETVYRDIASRVRDLMETLRGPNAP